MPQTPPRFVSPTQQLAANRDRVNRIAGSKALPAAKLKRHSGNVIVTEAGIAAMQRRRLPRSKRERKIADIARNMFAPSGEKE